MHASLQLRKLEVCMRQAHIAAAMPGMTQQHLADETALVGVLAARFSLSRELIKGAR